MPLTPQTMELPAFTVTGISTRTDNATEMSGTGGRIGPLWGQFLSTVAEPGTTYALYTNYESDHNGAYDVVIGRNAAAADGMVTVDVPAATYLVFPAAAATPDAIIAAWMSVYRYFAQPDAPKRAFTVDFERYSGDGVQLYIALA